MQSQGDTWVKHRKISQLCHLKKWIAFLTYTSDFSFLVSFPCLDCQHLIRMPTDSSYPPDSVSQRILEREGNWIQYSFICTYSAWDTRTTPSYILGFPGGSVVKNPPAGEARDVGLIPVLGRSPGVGKWQPTLASLVAQRSICLQCGRPGFDPWVGKIPWRKKWQHTPVFLPGEPHGWRSLVGYSPRGRKESDTTERLHFSF